jgi:transposase
MQVVHPVCCGIDGHAAQSTACLRRVNNNGQISTEWRDFGTTYNQLLTLRAWLTEQGCPIVVLESTGVYWKPIYHVLVETLEVIIANARAVRQRPGKKTDKADAAWLADLLAHGLVEPSFIPPPAVQALRDLTRTRVALVQTRTQVQNRISKVLEDTNIKVAHAMSDLFGTSGRRMLKALCAGERDPHKLATLAMGTLRRKLPELEVALTGQFTAHHGRLIQGELELMELLERQIADLDAQIRQATEAFEPQLEQLQSIPGIKSITARDIIAEIGADMRRFGSATRLSSWAGVSPGNNESAGKRRKGRTGKGNRYLRRVLVQCAWAARKTPTFVGRTFRRLESRLGRKKAAMAVAHKILVIAYHLLLDGTFCDESRYGRQEARQEEREKKRALAALERLGYNVTLSPVTEAAKMHTTAV